MEIKMLINVARRLPVIAALGLLIPAQALVAGDGYLPSSSAFKHIGYTIQDSAPAPVAAAPEVYGPAQVTSDATVYESAPESYAPETYAPAACAPACQCQCCSKEKIAALKAKAAGSHKPLHYLNDFSYLNDPCYDGHLLGDSLKGLGGNGITMDFGGQYRARVHREEQHRGLGITGVSDDFLLHRVRLYGDAKIGDNVRVFVEGLHADSNYESTGPRPIEENHLDLQNAFVDLTLLSGGGSKLVARAGRQEVALGGQRYVSPLDWANTRRTFDGGRLMYSNDDWNIDGFWLAPLVRDFRQFDEANENVALYGVYATNKSLLENGSLDLYWIAQDNDLTRNYFDSFGARYNGTLGDNLLFEAEGAYQFGTNADGSDHDAGFFTVGLGRQFKDVGFSPTSWVYMDWASGGDIQAAGQGHDHFQPLAHKYNGFMDLFGRRNLIDLNWLTTMKLSKKVTFTTWLHGFWLENEADTPYNVTMSPFAPAVTPTDDFLGTELDFLLKFGITPRSNVLFGYSRFWAGDYYDNPLLPASGKQADANFFYAQYTLNF